MLRHSLLTLLLFMAPAMAQTQADLNQSTCADVVTAKKKLNSVYQKVLNHHKGDAMTTAAIQKSQKAWLAFRAAQLEAIYPNPDKSNYGTVYDMCLCIESTKLYEQRIKQLSEWMVSREGDVCSGSR